MTITKINGMFSQLTYRQESIKSANTSLQNKSKMHNKAKQRIHIVSTCNSKI